jgi:hypothetical protein
MASLHIEMKKALAAAVAFSLFLAGCSKTEGENPAAVSGAQGRTEKSEEVQTPYYYGLIEEYRMTLAQDPHNLAAVIALGNAYYDSGQWKEAITLTTVPSGSTRERRCAATTGTATGISECLTAPFGIPESAGIRARSPQCPVQYRRRLVHDKKDYAAAVHIWENLLQLSPHHPQSEHMRSCIVTFRKVLKKDRP